MYKLIKQAARMGCYLILLIVSACQVLDVPKIEEPAEVLDENGVVISKPFIWEKDVSAKGYIWQILTPVFHENTVVVPGSIAERKGMLVALDIETGEEVWRWNDYVDGYDFEEVSSREHLNRKDNILIFNNAYRFCAVNLDNGTTPHRTHLQ